MLRDAAAATSGQPAPTPNQTSVPYKTKWNRNKKIKEAEKANVKRQYVRKVQVTMCRQCKKERDSAMHRQYFGNWYCQATAKESYEEWKMGFQGKGYGKRKSSSDGILCLNTYLKCIKQ